LKIPTLACKRLSLLSFSNYSSLPSPEVSMKLLLGQIRNSKS
jgi:hypothetical protein